MARGRRLRGARWERCPVAPGICRAGAGGSPVPLGGAGGSRCRWAVSVVPGVGGSRCRPFPVLLGRCRPFPVPAVPGAAGRCRRFPVPLGGVGGSRCRRFPVPAVPGAAGAVSAVPGAGRSRCRWAVSAVPGAAGRCRWFPVPAVPGAGRSRCRPFPVPLGGVRGRPRRVRMPGAAGPIGRRSHMPAGRRRRCRSSLPPSVHPPPSLPPSVPPSLLPGPGWRWERPRSHHEHPQGLQHVGDRLPGDQIPTERGNPNPGRQEHQVRAGGHLPGQRSPGGDEGQGRQPQSHPAPDRQRGPVLRGLRALRGSCGAKHSAGVPQVGLSPACPPSPDSACIPERPHLPPPSPVSAVLAPPPASQPGETPTTKTPHCSCL